MASSKTNNILLYHFILIRLLFIVEAIPQRLLGNARPITQASWSREGPSPLRVTYRDKGQVMLEGKYLPDTR